LLAFSRKQPLSPRALDVNEAVIRLVAILRRTLSEDIAVKPVLADETWPALADPSQLEDALLNLAVNARDASPLAGRLATETAIAPPDEDFAAPQTGVTPGAYVAVSVTDSGGGTTPAVIERAFEPFFTTKGAGRGTGLGLSMVYGFVKQSRGHVKIYSEVGHGTSIKLYLPRASAQIVNASEKPTASAAHQGGRETILLVEDDAAVRTVAGSILE